MRRTEFTAVRKSLCPRFTDWRDQVYGAVLGTTTEDAKPSTDKCLASAAGGLEIRRRRKANGAEKKAGILSTAKLPWSFVAEKGAGRQQKQARTRRA